jgi:acyl-CoA synthetase (AMP-forming)/AMP-acid ligase II/GNAT superfamily N-acetyltransferase
MRMRSPIPINTPADRERFCAVAGLSELTPDILARHRPDESWAVADAGGELVARCSLWWSDAPPLAGGRVGAVGHYAAWNAEAVGPLLDHACARLAAHGCTVAVAPMDGNTWRRYRLLTERGPEPPFLLEPDNPDDWPAHFTGHGFAPLAEYYSAVNDDLTRGETRADPPAGVAIRNLDLGRFEDELRAIHALSLASFTGNFLYTPIGEEEFVAQYRGVGPHVRPELVLLAEREGRLVGFLFALPDLMRARRGLPVDTVIFKTMAVHPDLRGQGLGGLLMGRAHSAARQLGFRRAVHALMHEDNHSRRISSHTARTVRRYTLFARPLRGAPKGRMPTQNIAEVLRRHAGERPTAVAIIDTHRGRPRTTPFADLDRLAGHAAGLLEERGLRPGDAVLVFHPMSLELYVALLAIFRLRLIAMFLDPSAGREHIERCCALHPPRGLIASAKAHLLRLWSPALRRIPVKFSVGWPVPGATRWCRLERTPPHGAILDCPPDTPALLTFTSGSTGQPKAAVRTHGFLLAQHEVLAASLRLEPADVDLTTLPIVLLANLGSGVTSVVPDADLRRPGAVAPGPILAQVRAHGVVSSTASPAFFERLARHCADHGETLPGLRKVFTGGAPVFPRLLDQVQAMAPAADVVAVYGSTEAEPIAHVSRHEISPDDREAMIRGRGLLAGPPVSEVQLRIIRDRWGTPLGPFTAAEFAAVCLPADEPGEIVVSGGHVLAGYLHGRGDSETKFRVDGTVWHRTGDAGYLDPHGRLWLLGRCSATVRDDRGTLHPFAAETAVYQDPAVRRAAAVAHRGRRVLAVEYYDGRRGTDLTALKASLGWAGFDDIRVCRSIPVDGRHNAKIDYPKLAALLDRP